MIDHTIGLRDVEREAAIKAAMMLHRHGNHTALRHKLMALPVQLFQPKFDDDSLMSCEDIPRLT